MKRLFYSLQILLLGILLDFSAMAQIRNHGNIYLEFSGGIPLLFDNQGHSTNLRNTFSEWSQGEQLWGLGICVSNAKANNHRVAITYKQENVMNSPANFKNFLLKYSYETTLVKGRNHLSYLGLLYGGGLGLETLQHSPNLALNQEKIYPFLNIGLNLEKYLISQFGIFIRLDMDATTANISQNIKANAQMGIKCKIR